MATAFATACIDWNETLLHLIPDAKQPSGLGSQIPKTKKPQVALGP